ncbi:hypothetical protein SKAU_G00241480 [Synaphobranchus kaupii]|uniref:Ig-like domain-containing protein n=1 Tax=Synaphobranchus kaupii TaxID=118154 RepID=A0A9Q1F7J6_SYNKA|nr:hypothetical protein SKAU_G00241480 [Synaphobranchus kaupii]
MRKDYTRAVHFDSERKGIPLATGTERGGAEAAPFQSTHCNAGDGLTNRSPVNTCLCLLGFPVGAVGIAQRLPAAVQYIYCDISEMPGCSGFGWVGSKNARERFDSRVQKKTTSMSLTISSCSRESSSSTVVQQRHSSLVQPLCISPQRCLHDISTVKGELVVMECRIRGTPPLQVLWHRGGGRDRRLCRFPYSQKE